MRLHFKNRNGKNQMVLTAGLWSYIILLLMRIPLSGIIGDVGMGLFAPAFELFWLVSLFTSYSMMRAMSGVIRYRVKREQYKNAGKVFRSAFFINLFVSIVLAAVLVILARVIADILVLETLSRMAIIAAAAAIVLAALIGTFRGYFNGYGLGVLVAHSQYIEKIAMLVCVLVCGNIFHGYGEKVSALLKAENYAYAYGALGAMIGVMLSQMITVLYLLVIYVIYAGTLKARQMQDSSKRMETQYSLQRILLNSSIPIALIAVGSNVFMLIDQRLFNYCMNRKEMGEMRTALWGGYYSRFAVVIGIGAALVCLSVYSMTGRISSAYEKEEYRAMRERIGRAVRRLCIVAFPMAIYLAVLAEALVKCLNRKGAADEVSVWVQKGAVIIVLYGFSFLFGQLLYKLHMVRELVLTTLITMIVHVVLAYLLVQKALLGADGIIYSLIICLAVYAAFNFLLIAKNLKYRQEWIRDVAFPAAAACVSGLVVMLSGRLLLEPVGVLLTIVIACLVGLVIYVLLLMALRVIGEAELAGMPFGFFFVMLGRNMRIL